jgi:mRNA interferase MazF
MRENIYNQWNIEKQRINKKDDRFFFINPREIWFTKMGQNIGYEENGKKEFSRPVLVLKKVGNLFFTVALTTKGKTDSRFYHLFEEVIFHGEHNNNNESWAILSQVKVMDKRRFEGKIGIVGNKEFSLIKQKITALLL